MDKLGFKQHDATTLFEDNQSCITLARNPNHHAHTKHIDIQHHFIRKKVKSGDISINYLATEEMITDALTKPLTCLKFEKFVNLMNLQN